MKKTVKNLMAVLLCLTMILSTGVFAFAVGSVSEPKAVATYNSITLFWEDVSGADGYEVYVASGSSWKKLAVTSSTAYSHNNLKINTTYKYRVRAYDKGSSKTTYGAFSPVVSAKTALSAVKGLKVFSVTETGFKLSWSRVSGATGYQIYRYTGGKWVYTYKTTTNSKTVTGAKLGVTYQYRVRAYRTVNGKNYYGPFSATVQAKCILTAPSGIKASSVTTTSATLSWKAVSSASGYQVYLKNGSKWVKKANVTANKYTIKGLNPGTKHEIRIRSFKKTGSTYCYSAWKGFSFTTAYKAVKVDPKKVPTTVAEICSTYNTVVNNAKHEKNVTMHKTGTLDLVCTDCSVPILQTVVDRLLKNFMMPIDTTITVRNGVGENLNEQIAPAGRTAALKASYVSAASAKKTTGGYKMAIRLKDEKSTFDGKTTVSAKGHASCLTLVNLAVLDLPEGSQINNALIEYPGATLVAYVNSSGKLQKLTVEIPFSGQLFGKLGATLSLTIEGQKNERYTFTY